MISINYCPPEVRSEHALAVFRMHWITRLQSVAGGVLLMAAVFWFYILHPYMAPILLETPWSNIVLLASSALFLLGWGITGYSLMLYYLTVATLTPVSLVDVDQISLFNRKIATLNLAQIQDVTVRQSGLLETFFDYGDVVVQTAGELPEFIFDNVPHPQLIAKKILDAQQSRGLGSE